MSTEIITIAPISLGGELEKAKNEAITLRNEANTLLVVDADSAKAAAEFKTKAATIEKNTELIRKTLKAPILEAGKKLDAAFKAVSDPLDEAKKVALSKVQAWQREQDAIARHEAETKRKADEEAALKRAEELREQGKGALAETLLDIAAENTQTPEFTPTKVEGIRTRKTWKMTAILDLSKVPLQYLSLNEVAVNGAIRGGVHDIPGLEIKEVETQY